MWLTADVSRCISFFLSSPNLSAPNFLLLWQPLLSALSFEVFCSSALYLKSTTFLDSKSVYAALLSSWHQSLLCNQNNTQSITEMCMYIPSLYHLILLSSIPLPDRNKQCWQQILTKFSAAIRTGLLICFTIGITPHSQCL